MLGVRRKRMEKVWVVRSEEGENKLAEWRERLEKGEVVEGGRRNEMGKCE